VRFAGGRQAVLERIHVERLAAIRSAHPTSWTSMSK
jgi:hypothetical protein